jgi:hypothetical protein
MLTFVVADSSPDVGTEVVATIVRPSASNAWILVNSRITVDPSASVFTVVTVNSAV